jgi:hypothetical protein
MNTDSVNLDPHNMSEEAFTAALKIGLVLEYKGVYNEWLLSRCNEPGRQRKSQLDASREYRFRKP